jgi:hypothetical protein
MLEARHVRPAANAMGSTAYRMWTKKLLFRQ